MCMTNAASELHMEYIQPAMSAWLCMPWQAVEDMNRQTGARVDPNATPDDMMSGASHTRGLMSAVSQLPQLIERKRTIEKHSSILHQLLGVRNAAA